MSRPKLLWLPVAGALLAMVALPAEARRKAPPPPSSEVLIEQAASTLTGLAIQGEGAWVKLLELADGIGHRLAGSKGLEQAVSWGVDRMNKDGLSNVRAEEVEVPVWIRGHAHARVTSPLDEELEILALGGSVATPEGGLTAPALVVGSFEELDARATEVAGRIVIYDVPFTSYGETVQYRAHGASRASAHGAVAALVRSVTTVSLNTPHTGGMRYAEDSDPIPTAAITVEDAARFHRWADAGVPISVHLDLGSHMAPDGISHNVIGEVIGRENPDEIVLLGCHLDSWDVGQGAQDDGGGCSIVMEAARLIGQLDTPPRRTVRVVLFTNEENGLKGALTYAEQHAGERHVAAIESDTGTGLPSGFRVDVRHDDEEEQAHRLEIVLAGLAPIQAHLAPLDAASMRPAYGGADIGPLVKQGVVGFGVDHDTTGYWPIHHTEADTVDKVDPAALRQAVAAVAVLAYALAETPEPLLAP